MAKYVVTGGIPLRGKVRLSGAKNSGFKLIIASLLADSPSRVKNVGLISEVDQAREIIDSLGSSVSQCGDHCFEIDPSGLHLCDIDSKYGIKSRSCIYYIPILLHRFGRALVPLPGGDRIAKRPLERHLEGLRAMGATIRLRGSMLAVGLSKDLNRLEGSKYRFAKNTHGGTDILILAAVLASGKTILENAAQEPEVDNLIEFLNLMGGRIRRDGRTIYIEGVKELQGATIKTIPDRNEAVTFGCSALGTRGDITVTYANKDNLKTFIDKVEEIGGGVELGVSDIRFFYKGQLKSTQIETAPYPGFMTDWQPLWTTLMTQASGKSIVHETVHESRFGYVPELVKMEAKIDLFRPDIINPDKVYNFNLSDDIPENPHAARIYGPTPLVGREVKVKDVRAGATLALAGLIAKGKTVIGDPVDQIKRGYENLAGKLVSLGAKIDIKNSA